ncbi:MAG: hypothetical protein EP330_20550 [Deltaproteobacteria bacterium]|nr:MAG: hypothetical protein EP330_20550 [Deltaproteobacteria bacterium]
MRPSLCLLLVLAACGEPPVEASCEENCVSAFSPFAFTIDAEAVTAESPVNGSYARLVPLGDIDGDGLADAGLESEDGVAVLTAAALAAGNAPVDLSGSSIRRAGDLDGDGVDDIAVLADGDLHLFTEGLDAPSAVLSHTADRPLRAVSEGADLDGDGRADLLVSEFVPDNRNKEIIRELSGADLAPTMQVADLFSCFGSPVDGDGPASIAMLGDFDGDGTSDVATGATRNFAGVHTAARLGSGFFGGLSDQEVHVHECHPDGCDAGVSVQAIGDTENDGLADLLVTAWPEPGVWVVPGLDLANKHYASQLVGGVAIEGRHLADATWARPAGDPTGEGAADLIVGLASGDVLLVNGLALTETEIALPTDLAAEEAAGEAATVLNHFALPAIDDAVGIGDADGDGVDDLVVLSDGAVLLIGSAR